MSRAQQPPYALLALLTSLALVLFLRVLFIEELGVDARRALAAMLVPLAFVDGYYLWRASWPGTREG